MFRRRRPTTVVVITTSDDNDGFPSDGEVILAACIACMFGCGACALLTAIIF